MTEAQMIAAEECCLETIAACRVAASNYRQMGFKALADWHKENARNAEMWLVRFNKKRQST